MCSSRIALGTKIQLGFSRETELIYDTEYHIWYMTYDISYIIYIAHVHTIYIRPYIIVGENLEVKILAEG